MQLTAPAPTEGPGSDPGNRVAHPDLQGSWGSGETAVREGRILERPIKVRRSRNAPVKTEEVVVSIRPQAMSLDDEGIVNDHSRHPRRGSMAIDILVCRGSWRDDAKSQGYVASGLQVSDHRNLDVAPESGIAPLIDAVVERLMADPRMSDTHGVTALWGVANEDGVVDTSITGIEWQHSDTPATCPPRSGCWCCGRT